MRRLILILLALVAIVLIYFIASGRIDVNQTRDAELPNVSAEGGQLPTFDVDVNTNGIEQDAAKAGDTLENAVDDAGEAIEDADVPKVDVDIDTKDNN